MKVLAMDTSSKICSVAIIEDNKVLKEMHNESQLEHSQTLMPMIKNILEEQNLKITDMDLFASSIGPGSFTGTRIGIATVKAFSDATKIPVVGINSLEAQGYSVLRNEQDECKILSMIDARNDFVYFAVYKMKNGKISLYKNPAVINILDATEFIDFNDKLYIVGDVKFDLIDNLLQAKFQEEKCKGKDVKQYEYIKPNDSLAIEIGKAAISKFNNEIYGNSMSIHPMYLRKSQAERQRLKIDESEFYILKPTKEDFDNILENYEKFPNIWTKEQFYEDSKNSEYYIAKRNDEVLGFVSIKTILDEVEVMNIVTKIDKRNEGIASDLLSYIIRKLNVNKINLEVNANNKAAIRIYKDFGFEENGVRKNYYNNNTEDAILMSLTL